MRTLRLSFSEFEILSRSAGFREVLVRTWGPLTEVPTQSHRFHAKAAVVQGEMWLTQGSHEQHLLPGDGFELARALPYAERYGPEGVTYWVARR